MSGGNIRVGAHKKRFMHQAFFTSLTTGEGLGTEETPYTRGMEVGSYGSVIQLSATPWSASLVGVTSVAQYNRRVEAGSLKIEMGYLTYPDGTWQGWDFGPGDWTVTPSTMEGVANWQWETWDYANGVYVLPAKAAVRVRVSLVNCVLGDGSAARWMAQIVLEPTR